MRMILAAAVVFATLALALGCSDDSTKPTGETSPYSGRFYATYSVLYTNCTFPAPLDGPVDILISGNECDFEDMVGTWESSAKTGYGHSATPTCIPIPPNVGCQGCYTMSFAITFASPDSFSGTYGVGYTYSTECATDSCHTQYLITGTRM